MASGAERQAAWRARRDEEFKRLRAVAGDGRGRPADHLVRACFEAAQAKSLKRDQHFGADDIPAEMILRGDATIGTTTVSGWASELARTAWKDYLISLAPTSAAGRLVELATPAILGQDSVLNFPIVPAGPATIGWVAEGAPIAIGAASFATVVLGPPRKLGSIFVWSRELALRSDATTIFQTLLRESIAASIDSAMLSATAGSAAAHAGLLAGVTPIAGLGGGDLTALETDLVALSNACAASGGSGRITFVMSADRLARLQIIAPILAGAVDAVASGACPATRIIGIDAASLVIAVDQEPEISSVNCGTIHMSTVPLEIVSTAPATADPVRDIWSTAAVASRVLHWLAYAKRTATCVNFIDNATW